MERMMGKLTSGKKALELCCNPVHSQPSDCVYPYVIGRDETGKLVIRGLFIGDDMKFSGLPRVVIESELCVRQTAEKSGGLSRSVGI